MLAQKKQKKEMKLAIVTNSESVMQSPEVNMPSLRELTKCLESSKYTSSRTVRSLLIASLCVVYKDILPSYRVRLLSEHEKSQPMKKETKKIRFFEENLLTNYRKFVDLLQVILGGSVKNQKKSQRTRRYEKVHWNKVDRAVALKCACQLLESHPQFNFSEELVKLVLPYLNSSRDQISNIVLESLLAIFTNDREGETTLAICRAIHTFARKKSYRFRPAVAKALSLVPITEVVDEAAKIAEKIDRSQKSRKERKKDKLERKHEKEMAETRAAKSHEERVKLNTLILNEILFVYFKVLKSACSSELFSRVLEGLSVYSNLINVIYVDSLLAILNRYVEHKDTKLWDQLNCIHTALNILNNPASTIALRTDPTRFYNRLYALLGRMSGAVCPSDGSVGPSSALRDVAANYGRSNTPAAQAVAQMIRREQITRLKNTNKKAGVESTIGGSDIGGPDGELDATSSSHHHGRVSVTEAERLTDVLLSCLYSLLINRRREVTIKRVLAFAKRLTSVALTMPDSACTGAMLVFLIHLLHLFPRCEVLFDSETEVGGTYRPDVDDPELCLPASACLWELELLQSHPSPTVQALAKLALQWGRISQTHGPNVAVAKTINYQVGRTGLTMKELLFLPADQVRSTLSQMDSKWIENKRMPEKISQTKRQRAASRYTPSAWLSNIVASVGLGLADEFTEPLIKRARTDSA